jgi:hypothetical protein
MHKEAQVAPPPPSPIGGIIAERGSRTHDFRLLDPSPLHFCLISENGKRKFVFLCQQIINGTGRLLFQQTCQSMLIEEITFLHSVKAFYGNAKT